MCALPICRSRERGSTKHDARLPVRANLSRRQTGDGRHGTGTAVLLYKRRRSVSGFRTLQGADLAVEPHSFTPAIPAIRSVMDGLGRGVLGYAIDSELEADESRSRKAHR